MSRAAYVPNSGLRLKPGLIGKISISATKKPGVSRAFVVLFESELVQTNMPNLRRRKLRSDNSLACRSAPAPATAAAVAGSSTATSSLAAQDVLVI